MPRVSIIMPTFNLAPFLPAAIDSALAQTYTDYEIVVADDGSTDETPAVLAAYAGKIISVVQENRGVASARNLALARASGELIAYLDADDMWYPQKLERQVAHLDAHPEHGLVHSDTAIVDGDGAILYRAFNRETGRPVPQGACLEDLMRWCHIQPLTVVERRRCVELTGGFDERLRGVDDYFRWILLAMEGIRFGYLDEPLALYRWRAGNFSHSRTYREAFVILYEILLREKGLARRCGPAAAAAARARLREHRFELAYADRAAGRLRDARQGLRQLLRESPASLAVYGELVKAWIPPAVAGRLRRLRTRAPQPPR